ncbi:hypothetical protein CYY_005701 [Polysphondylium violaceum]|uniref:Gamma-glutamylcyclotransferase AIG2-like domain-containing protein n=1 Tax=Polysphondylium violaceum TaxID=133409 RepID=A0A8J4V6M0_9MYCE|nr:hypothetical protein CYY_005701 [Polysphondylium violaceum]
MNKIKSIFVYGTLRPDDNSSAPWTLSFSKSLVFKKCFFPHGIMFHDEFPVVSLLYKNIHACSANGDKGHHDINLFDEEIDTESDLYKLYNELNCNGIVGYVATIDDSLLTNNNDTDEEEFDRLFKEKLIEADEIEEYPQLYERSIIKVHPIIDDHSTTSHITTTTTTTTTTTHKYDKENHIYCYIYHIQNCNREKIIRSGNWLTRHLK